MKAIAVRPGTPDSVHMAELEKPSVTDVPGGRGVLVQVLQVGVDGTDKEINEALYGEAPPGYDFLVIGHESFGRVVEVGPEVTELAPGDYVNATVRRPGGSIYDTIGHYDMTTDDKYYERGICHRHGFLTEFYVDEPEYIVKVPAGLAHIGVLGEPMSIVQKAIYQTYEIQRRLRVWHPRKALVLGAGAIGQLSTVALRMRGLEVTCMARTPAPNNKAALIEEIGAVYADTTDQTLEGVAAERGPYDLIIEASGRSDIAFKCMELLATNGVLCLTSITGGERVIEVPSAKINLDFVLNNKVMFGTVNAHREYFEQAVKDFAQAEATYPGWMFKLLTHPINGLDNYESMMETLVNDRGALKVYVNVST